MYPLSVLMPCALRRVALRCVSSTGDVLEVFVAPVAEITDSPAWYLELDTASSGALWGMLGHNPLNRYIGVNRGGNSSNMGCAQVQPASSCSECSVVPSDLMQSRLISISYSSSLPHTQCSTRRSPARTRSRSQLACLSAP